MAVTDAAWAHEATIWAKLQETRQSLGYTNTNP
jgi:hypothetical protein